MRNEAEIRSKLAEVERQMDITDNDEWMELREARKALLWVLEPSEADGFCPFNMMNDMCWSVDYDNGKEAAQRLLNVIKHLSQSWAIWQTWPGSKEDIPGARTLGEYEAIKKERNLANPTWRKKS